MSRVVIRTPFPTPEETARIMGVSKADLKWLRALAERVMPTGGTVPNGAASDRTRVGFLYTNCVGFLQAAEMRQQKTLRERMEARIVRKRGDDVFLPREFRDLGGEDQVLRVLRGLVREKRLVRLGYGVYGRAVVSRLSGEPILYSPNGFPGAARQALTKLGVAWEPTDAERAYNHGRSTQVPVNPVVRVKGRFSRRLSDGIRELVLER